MKHKKLLSIFLLSISFFGLFNFSILDFSTSYIIDKSSIEYEEDSQSIFQGDNLEQNRPYNFTFDYSDPSNYAQSYDDDCYLETQYVDDPDLGYNDSYSPDNTNLYNATNENHTLTSGDIYYNGTMDLQDDDATIMLSDGGNRNATYTFYGDYGKSISEIDFVDVDNSIGDYDITVEYDLDNHRDVLKLVDGDASGYVDFYNEFETNSTVYIVEFWFRTNSTASNDYFVMDIYNDATNLVHLMQNEDKLDWSDGVSWNTVYDGITVNTWYHFKMRMDNDAEKLEMYLNNELKFGDYIDSATGSGSYYLGFYTRLANYDYCYYIDDVGYSWDENYTIGDNWYYNNYIGNYDFEDVETDSFGYYGNYDFEDNNTGEFDYGYSTYSWDNYSMPDENYYATYDYENITTTVGNYYGTYSFEGETGETGTDISFVNGTSATCSVISSLGGHNEVLQMTTTTAYYTWNYFDGDKTSGTVEFWIRTTADVTSYYALKEDGNLRIICGYSAGYNGFFYYNGGSPVDPSKPMSLDTWYHVRIIFYATNTFDAYFNGEVVVSGATNYASYTDGIDSFQIWNGGAVTNYLDGVGYSWDTTSNEGYGYTTGFNFDNANPLDFLKSGIDVYPKYDCNVYTLDLSDQHGIVTRIDDFSTTQKSWIRHTYAQTSGTIEYWFRTTDSTKLTYMIIGGAGGLEATTSYCSGGNFYTWTGAPTLLTSCASNTWYHIRLDFDCGTDQTTIYINGVDEGTYSFINAQSTLYTFDFYTYNSHTSYASYLDAFSYDWDTYSTYGYEAGWNINPFDITDLLHDGFDVDYNYGATISLYSTLGSHSDVLRLYDYSSTKVITIEDYFNQTYGTIEFFFQMDDVTKALYWRLQSQGSDIAYFYDALSSSVTCSHSGGTDTLQSIISNTWYHFRIDFECTSGGYLGLSQYEFRVWIDSANYEEFGFKSNVDFIDSFQFNTGSTPTGYNCYLEDYSYSWDSNYDIGENTYGSSFDDSFRNYIGGSDCSTSIVYDESAHRRVIEIDDSSSVYQNYLTFYFNDVVWGTIEFYYKKTNTNYGYILLYEDNTQLIYIHIDDYIQYYDGTAHDLQPISDNEWHFIKILFACSSDTFYLRVDDNEYTSLGFRNAGNYANNIRFGTHPTFTTTIYLDAFSYTWDGTLRESSIYRYEDAPSDWYFYSYGDCNMSIIGEDNCHKKIYQMLDYDSSYYNWARLDMDRPTGATRGYASFWFKINDATKEVNFSVMDGSIAMAEFRINSGYFQYYDSGWQNLCTIKNDEWCLFRVRLSVDYWGYEQFNIYVNGSSTTKYCSGSYADYIIIQTGRSDYGIDFRIDSYDKDNSGDNLDLFTSFTIEFTTKINVEDIDDALAFEVNGFHKSNIYSGINFYIYDYQNTEWDLINGSILLNYEEISYIWEGTLSYYEDGDKNINIKYSITNSTNYSVFYLDCLNVTTFDYLKFRVEKSFNILGTWKYRVLIPQYSFTSDWVYFNVILHDDNVMLISESNYITDWVFSNWEASDPYSKMFEFNFTGHYDWEFLDSSYSNLTQALSVLYYPLEDAYVSSNLPDSNYGSSNFLAVVDDGTDLYYSFLKFPYMENFEHMEEYSDSNLYFQVSGYLKSFDDNFYVYNTSDFDEDTITYNNMPSEENLYGVFSSAFYTANWYISGLNNTLYLVMFDPSANNDTIYFYSKESYYYDSKPRLTRYIYRYLNNDDGCIFFQEAETATRNIRTENLGINYLESNDYIDISLETSLSDVYLDFIYDDNVVHTEQILDSNINFGNQTISILINNDILFDRIQIRSTYNKFDYIYLRDVSIYEYSSEIGGINTFHLSPYDSNSFFVEDYGLTNLKIYDNNVLRENYNVTITHDMEDNILQYVPTYALECRLTIIDTENNLLDVNMFEIYITRTYSESTGRVSLLEDIFYADTGTTILFEFYDRFGVFIQNTTSEVEQFIFVEMEIYTLKIENKALNYSYVKIERNGTSLELDDYLAPDEIINYRLVPDMYVINWLNYENDEIIEYNITLTSDYVLVLPSSYYDVYFSAFNFDGLGLDTSMFRFYINGYRKDFGFNTIDRDLNNLLVLDFFNQTLYNEDIYLNEYTEYNIYLEVYTLLINNNYNRSVRITLERGGVEIEQIIPMQSGFTYRFLPNIAYDLEVYDLDTNEKLYNERITLDQNNKVVSFGFYETEIPAIPQPFDASNYMVIFWAFIIVFIVVLVVFGAYIYMRRDVAKEANLSYTNKIKKTRTRTKNSFDNRYLYEKNL